MNIVPLPTARVASSQQSMLLSSTLNSSQVELLNLQNQISSGHRLSAASDDPAAAVGLERMNQQQSGLTQYTKNLNFGSVFLNSADSSLASENDLLGQALSIARTQIGITSTPDERLAQAQVIDSILNQSLSLSNTRYQGMSLFGGGGGTLDAFKSVGSGFLYQGSNTSQGILTAQGESLDYSINGAEIFGGLSNQATGYQDLTPGLTADTRLSDLTGVTGSGVTPGLVNVTVGTTTQSVDLSAASTVGDIQRLLENALSSQGLSVNLTGGRLVLSSTGSQAISFAAAAGHSTAEDLGLVGTLPVAGSLTGGDLDPKLTTLTALSSLRNGAGIDLSGLQISNDSSTTTVSLAGITTVGGLLNKLNASGTNIRAQINAAGTGIELYNPMSGAGLGVGENGGTTAQDLGIRTSQPNTALNSFNFGVGVNPISATMSGPKGTILITRPNGASLSVDVSGISTASGLVAAINAAGSSTGLVASLNASGNGISLSDSVGGSGNLSVAAGSSFASNGSLLGIFKTGTGGSLIGDSLSFSTDDFKVTRRDGSSFTVNLTGAKSLQDALDKINGADGNQTAATKVTASLRSSGNGIQLTDASSGSGSLTVTALNASPVASELGILSSAASTATGTILGSDTAMAQPAGIFSTLTLLRNALRNNDQAGISRAATLLDSNVAQVTRMRGLIGARSQDMEMRKSLVSDQANQLTQSISLLGDTDFTQAITKFQMLQTAYDGSLKVAQQMQKLTLLDFLN